MNESRSEPPSPNGCIVIGIVFMIACALTWKEEHWDPVRRHWVVDRSPVIDLKMRPWNRPWMPGELEQGALEAGAPIVLEVVDARTGAAVSSVAVTMWTRKRAADGFLTLGVERPAVERGAFVWTHGARGAESFEVRGLFEETWLSLDERVFLLKGGRLVARAKVWPKR